MSDTRIQSSLRCPACGFAESLIMPENACIVLHSCTSCGLVIRPATGDCCVFCSYGSVPCPPIQEGTPREQLTCEPLERDRA